MTLQLEKVCLGETLVFIFEWVGILSTKVKQILGGCDKWVLVPISLQRRGEGEKPQEEPKSIALGLSKTNKNLS